MPLQLPLYSTQPETDAPSWWGLQPTTGLSEVKMAGHACVLLVVGLSTLEAALWPLGHESCQHLDVAVHCLIWWISQVSGR